MEETLTHQKYLKLKEKQDSLIPYLTFSIMRETLGYTSNSPVQHLLKVLIAQGKVEEVDFGSGKRYRIL